MYCAMIQSLADAGKYTSDTNKVKTTFKAIPVWSDYVKSTHEEARKAFILWLMNSKPNYGAIFDLIKTSRARFKYYRTES